MEIILVILFILLVGIIVTLGVMSDNNRYRDNRLRGLENAVGVNTDCFLKSNRIEVLEKKFNSLPQTKAEKAQELINRAKELLEEKDE